ncbi:hypothetical protein GCM10009839_52360 [Catenulispora yoronensis]|uniref:Thioredoxin domain-containing protein n=1 Tax=Catenulispora yoronensis TaxID=450799 RepID=A0ABP5GB92_9ACTN
MSGHLLTLIVLVLCLGNSLLILRLAGRLRFLLDPVKYPLRVPSLPVGRPAPAFSAEALDGGVVDSSRYLGSTVTLIFISDHCAGCRRYLPLLGEWRDLARGTGGELLAAAFLENDKTTSGLARLVRQYDIPCGVLLIPRDHPLHAYNPRKSTPFFYHLDRGVVRARGLVGTGDWEALVETWSGAAQAGHHSSSDSLN